MEQNRYLVSIFVNPVFRIHYLVMCFALSVVNCVHAEPKVNDLWFPNFVDAKIVSNEMVVNGVTMQIWEIRSKKTVEELSKYYQNLWSAEPGFLHYPVNNWQVTGFIQGRWFVSLQLLNKQLDSFGYLTISTYPERNLNDQKNPAFILPSGSTLMTNIYAEDGPHKSRTITFRNKQSFESNVDFFRRYFVTKGWAEDEVPATTSSNKTLLFRKGPDNATISINNLSNGIGGVGVLVEH